MMNLNMLGAVDAAEKKDSKKDAQLVSTPARAEDDRTSSWPAVVGTFLGGAAGVALWRNHPVLGLLNGLALGGNVARLATREIPLRRAAENIGAHAVATASSLALPGYPVLGYLAGAAGSNLFLRRRDNYRDVIADTVLGAAPGGYTDRETVLAVQRAIMVLPQYKTDKLLSLEPYGADGKWGPVTARAVGRINAYYREGGAKENDGEVITDGTLVALKVDRPVRPADEPRTVLTTATATAAKDALVPVKKSAPPDAGRPIDAVNSTVLFGRPLWQVALAGAGVLGVAGAVYALVGR